MDIATRRKFLATCLGGIGAVAAALLSYPLFRYLAPRRDAGATARVEIPVAEVAEGGARFFQYEGRAAVLVKKKGGELIALSAGCTHLGCIVQWQKDKEQFLCPCHAGVFTTEGAVVAGPPPKPLAKLPFVVAEGKIVFGH